MRVNLYNKEGETIDMDALAKAAFIEERKVNSAIRNLNQSLKKRKNRAQSTIEDELRTGRRRRLIRFQPYAWRR